MSINKKKILVAISSFLFACIPLYCNAKERIRTVYDRTAGMPSSGSDESEGKNQYDNYPFIEAPSKIEAARVAGIRVKGKEIIYLSFDKTFSKETLKENEIFSDMKFFQQFPNLISVEFNSILLGEEAIKNIQKFLPHNIKNLVFDRCKIKDGAEERIAAILKKASMLTSLTIKQIKMAAEYTSIITEAISELSAINSIVLAFGEMQSDSLDHLALAVERSKNLKTLSLAFDKITVDDDSGYKKLLEMLSKTKKLTTFEISIIQIPETYIKPLINKIGKLQSLKNLRFFLGNAKKQEDVKRFENGETLAKALKNLTELVNLNISSMNLPSDVMQIIAQSISSLKNLEYLNISGNVIDQACGSDLSESFKKLEHLKTFIARKCSMDSNTFSELVRSMSSMPIAILSVGNNKIQDGIKSIPIKSMEDLKFIDLANNSITFESLMSFLKELVGHPKLQMIDVKNNGKNEEKDGDEVERNITGERDAIEKFKMENKLQVGIFGW